jgi:hypothetical protein
MWASSYVQVEPQSKQFFERSLTLVRSGWLRVKIQAGFQEDIPQKATGRGFLAAAGEPQRWRALFY